MTLVTRERIKILALVLVAGIGTACSKDPAPPPAATQAVGGSTPSQAAAAAEAVALSMERPNLVLITMEATRADHLGCYLDPTAQTPVLDQLAHEGVYFESAIATAPLTLPSLASILTGQYPPRHGVRDNSGFTLDDAQTTLAEHLKAQGFATAAAVGSRVLSNDAGLKQGFDSYAPPGRGSRSAAFVVNDAIDAINRIKSGPFFLWVQLDDPQAPYLPPPGMRTKFAGRLYDGEIAWMDTQLKRLVDHLKNQGVLDTTVIVATAPEGESLGEHGEETHGLLLYDTTLKVPLIVRYPPRIEPGAPRKNLVSLVDLAPTLLELMGLPPLPAAQGKSFLASLVGGAFPEREPVYAESLFGERAFGWAPLHAIRSVKAKFIDAPDPEVYDVRRDPSETINAVASDPSVAATLRPHLEDLMKAIGVGAAEAAPSPSGRDPKSLVAVSNLYLRAQMVIEEGHPEQAPPLLTQALQKDPGNPAAKALLAGLRGQPVTTGGPADNTFASQWNQGNAYYAQGKLPEAAKAFRAALALNPASAETHYVLGNVLSDQGDLSGAEGELRAAVAANSRMADGWNKLGIVLDKTKRRPEALTTFTRALEIEPDHPDALFNRARVEVLESYLVDARRDLDRLLKAHEDYAAGRYLEAHLCMAEKDTPGAKAALTKFLALPNTDPRMKASAEEMLKKIGG